MLNARLLEGSSPQLGISIILDLLLTIPISETHDFQITANYTNTPMANAHTTIAAIQALPQPPEGRCWINGSIEVSVSRCKDSTGKGPSKCSLKDSTGYMDGEFWGRSISQYDGQTIRISGKGISRGDYNGKKSISVPDKCPITILEDSPVSAGSGTAATQGRGGSAQSGGNLDASPVRERVHCYFQVLKEVAGQYKKLQEDSQEGTIPKLTASDIKDIATHLSMTYRGEFGSYAKPIFEAVKVKQEPAREPEDDFQTPSEDSDDLPF